MAISKLQPIEAIHQLYTETGHTVFGENYVQEVLPKIGALKGLSLEWHFVGRLQRNKVKHLIGHFALIHSVDSLELAESLNHHASAAGLTQSILLQCNLAGEKTKGGSEISALQDLALRIVGLPNLRIEGLMAMPPLSVDPETARPFFQQLRVLRDQLQGEIPSLKELSMGTSTDYRVAIEEGATMIRLGTILFGPRPAKA